LLAPKSNRQGGPVGGKVMKESESHRKKRPRAGRNAYGSRQKGG